MPHGTFYKESPLLDLVKKPQKQIVLVKKITE
jgi:hypothetical protein